MGIGRLDGVNLMRVGQASKRKGKDCSIGDLRLGLVVSCFRQDFLNAAFQFGQVLLGDLPQRR